jgi:hypothetical protein
MIMKGGKTAAHIVDGEVALRSALATPGGG